MTSTPVVRGRFRAVSSQSSQKSRTRSSECRFANNPSITRGNSGIVACASVSPVMVHQGLNHSRQAIGEEDGIRLATVRVLDHWERARVRVSPPSDISGTCAISQPMALSRSRAADSTSDSVMNAVGPAVLVLWRPGFRARTPSATGSRRCIGGCGVVILRCG